MTRIKRCPYCHGAAHLLIDWDSKKSMGIMVNMLHVLCVLQGHKPNKMQIKPLMNGIIKQ